ncbi:MAG: DUF6438 domain-containing protein [Pyrinomonadaceae bacterium]
MKRFLFVLFFLISVSHYSFAQSPKSGHVLITLERNPGYWGEVGTAPCPFYKLSIFDKGAVEIEPKNYVEYKLVIGQIIKTRISLEQVKQLIAEFQKIDFFVLKSTFENKENSREECPQYGSDGVTATTSITIEGKTKLVEHYHGCGKTEAHSKLIDLENMIDEIANIKQWFDCYGGKNRKTLSYTIEPQP